VNEGEICYPFSQYTIDYSARGPFPDFTFTLSGHDAAIGPTSRCSRGISMFMLANDLEVAWTQAAVATAFLRHLTGFVATAARSRLIMARLAVPVYATLTAPPVTLPEITCTLSGHDFGIGPY